MRTTNSERISSILFEPEHVMSDSIVAKSMLIAIQSMKSTPNEKNWENPMYLSIFNE